MHTASLLSPPRQASAAKRSGWCAGLLISLILLACLFSVSFAYAEGPSLTIDLGQGGGKQTAVVLQILALFTVLSLAPALFIMVTSFTRMVIVLSFLRQAMGTQQVPPNQVLISLALFLTMFVMAPVGQAVYKDALQPLLAEQIGYEDAWNRGIQPIRAFMLKQMRDKDLELFMELSLDVHGHDVVAAGDDFAAVQTDFVRAGRRLVSGRRIDGQELSVGAHA